jgi:hypothetical protein
MSELPRGSKLDFLHRSTVKAPCFTFYNNAEKTSLFLHIRHKSTCRNTSRRLMLFNNSVWNLKILCLRRRMKIFLNLIFMLSENQTRNFILYTNLIIISEQLLVRCSITKSCWKMENHLNLCFVMYMQYTNQFLLNAEI